MLLRYFIAAFIASLAISFAYSIVTGQEAPENTEEAALAKVCMVNPQQK